MRHTADIDYAGILINLWLILHYQKIIRKTKLNKKENVKGINKTIYL